MNHALRHRGPDTGGEFSFTSCILGHRRLSILDLSDAARQPMLSADGMVALVFNGEIYNFQELRSELEGRGQIFHTRSDTEVLLGLYLDSQESMLDKLNGMFSFAIWDERNKRLILARDRMGKKPLYYHVKNGRLSFSSEISSLIQDTAVPGKLSNQALSEYLLYDFIPAPHTIFERVSKLPAAHMAIFDSEGLRVRRYWSPPEPEQQYDYDEKVAQLEALLEEAVTMRLVSDVPLGSFLSGGIDSTLVTSFMKAKGLGRVKTFSIAFPGTTHDESQWSRMAASFLETDHHEQPVKYDIETIFPEMVRHFGEPFGDSSAIPSWHLCGQTRQQVTVALSGDGGDELFGGYERYLARRFQLAYDLLPAVVRQRIVEPVVERFPATTDYYGTSLAKKLELFVTAAARIRENPLAVVPRTFTKDQVARLTGSDYAIDLDPVIATARQWFGLDPVSRMMFTDMQTYLAEDILTKVDRMSMAHSLEVRSPLLDYRLVESACRMPLAFKIRGRVTKRILRRAAKGRVPEKIIKRSKYGFQVPLGEWFKTDLKTWTEDRLFDRLQQHFDPEFVRSIWREHQEGKADHAHKIWLLVFFNEWSRQFRA